jgi:hypothetical protein
MRFVHCKCLQIWLNMKLVGKKQGNLWSYSMKAIECEICKTAYPRIVSDLPLLVTVVSGGQRYTLIELPKPTTGSFIQLETIAKDKTFGRVVHILIPDAGKRQFRLGRGHDAEVKIPDISVSRIHAQLSLTERGYQLEDNGSKFGTLLLLPPTPHEIDPINGMLVQISRTTLTLAVKKMLPTQKLQRAMAMLGTEAEEQLEGPLDENERMYFPMQPIAMTIATMSVATKPNATLCPNPS